MSDGKRTSGLLADEFLELPDNLGDAVDDLGSFLGDALDDIDLGSAESAPPSRPRIQPPPFRRELLKTPNAEARSPEPVRSGEPRINRPATNQPTVAPNGRLLTNADQTPAKPVGAVLRQEAPPMSVERIFTVSSRFAAAARADRDGNVLAMQNDFDAETICAAVAMARTSINNVAELLGLGDPTSWAASGPASCVYVVENGDGFYTVLGEAEKNPEGLLKRLTNFA